MRWEKFQLDGFVGPGRRWGHTCNAIKRGRLLYVFGGYGRNNAQTNQVHVFDTVKRTWSEVLMTGAVPTPRDSHTCTTVGDNLFVFGGTDGIQPLGDLIILDTSSNKWVSPSVRGDGPEAREGHSAALVGKRLFIFGGCGMSEDSEVHYDDLYILNTETFFWRRAVTSGTPPSRRDSHTCSSWKNKIIVIGGEDSFDYYLSDVHILDTDTLVWCKLNTTGQLLPPRAGHTTVALGKYLFVVAGFSDEQNLYNDVHMLDIENGTWTKIMATGQGPSGRFSMAGDSLDPSMPGVLVFIGGCNKNLEALDDMYYLHTELVMEPERDDRRMEKLSLRKQLRLKCQEQQALSTYDKALVRVENNANVLQPMPVATYQPSQPNVYLNDFQTPLGKKTFEAMVTESFAGGYTIETVIDGKPLRGLLFSSKPTVSNETLDDSIRKMENVQLDAAKMNDDQNASLHKLRPTEQKIEGAILTDDALKENVIAPEPQIEAAATETKRSEPSNVSVPPQVLGTSKLSAVLDVNLESNGKNDEPHSSSEIPEDYVSAVKDSVT